MSSKGYTEAEVIIDRCLNTHTCVWRHVKIHTQGGVQHTPTSDYFCLKLGIAPKLRDIKDASYFATSKNKQTFEDISFAFKKKKN